jgi:sortase A
LGPGRYPSSAMPGEPGMVAIAGHRVTYGAPFYELDILEPGDEIHLETDYGSFAYAVTDQAIVDPQDTWVLDPEHGDLVLTTCHPRMSDRQRLVVWGKEVAS